MNRQTLENKGESDRFSRDPRAFRDFRDSRDSSSEKTPFVMTPLSGPETFQHANPFVRRTVLRSSRGPCYERDLPMQGIIC